MASKKLRIVHVTTPYTWRGGEQQLAYLIDELRKKDVAQAVICPIGSEMEKYCIENSITHNAFKKRFGVDPIFAKKVNHLCKQFDANLIHAHDSQAHTLAVMASDIYKNSLPIVVNRRVIFPIGKSLMSRYKYNHSKIKAIVCVSSAVKILMEQHIKNPKILKIIHSGIPKDKFQNSLEENFREKHKNLEGKILVGNISALTKEKDYHAFVRTAQILKNGGFNGHYLIVGKGKEKDRIVEMVKDSKMTDDFSFLGHVNDVSGVLESLDVLLFTSRKEGLGTAVLDAYIKKVPVVSTKSGGVEDIIEHLQTGYLSEPGDADDLANGVKLFVDDPELRDKVITNSSEKLKGFYVNRTGDKVHELYKEILAND